MVTCLIISSLTVRFVQIRLTFLIWTGFFCVSNEEQQISYPVAKPANHSWKNGRSSGSCVKWSECKPPLCKNIKGWKSVSESWNLFTGRSERLRKCWIKQLPKHYFRIFRLIFSNSLPPRVLWVRSLLSLPADAFFRYCPGVQPLCWRNCLQKCSTLL